MVTHLLLTAKLKMDQVTDTRNESLLGISAVSALFVLQSPLF